MIFMGKKRIMVIFGTRPEAIKMVPVIKVLEKAAEFELIVVVTGQHRQMLDQVLETFDVSPASVAVKAK
jgi:UDP-N-acetylglucosamine 2-epimerase (non-hydrolysing)